MTTKTPDPTAAAQVARVAIGTLLDGNSPNGADPAVMGPYGECYREMVRAYSQGGTATAQTIFATYAKADLALAALRAGDPRPRRQEWSIADLRAANFPDPKWAVRDLLPVGLVFFAGRPKLGKSWLALQLAVAVATGGMALGRKVEEARVLYLALEDSPRRMLERVNRQHAPDTDNLKFRYEWQPLAGQGTADLYADVDERRPGLVVIDTISRALGRADQMDQADMNVAMGALQRLALDRDFCLLVVDHHRKSASSGAGDVIDDVLGATSKAGVADAALGLYRERGKQGATLKVTGRDVDDQELALQWDVPSCSWEMTGTAAGVRAETVQADIVLALGEHGGEATAAEIARFLGKAPSNITRELQELVGKGVVVRGQKRGKTVPYRLVEDEIGAEVIFENEKV